MPAPLMVRLSRVSFAYDGRDDIFRDLTLQLEPGWTGVVGPNGGGKTTLLRLLHGELAPTAGAIDLHPRDARIHLCSQRVDLAGDAIEAFGWAWDRGAIRARGRLGLDPEDLGRWGSLSPGERKRWQIGAAIHARPDVLLLDEPTNHLDLEARRSLMEVLRRYRGIGLVVSHDRTLLDELSSATIRVDRQAVTLYPGAYSCARQVWQANEHALRQAATAARRQARALDRRLADARRKHDVAVANTSTRRRMKGTHDSDARSSANKARAANGEAARGREVSVLRAASERAHERAGGHRLTRQRGSRLFVDYARAPMPTLVTLERPALHAGDHLLLTDVSLRLGRDTRAHLRGPNGAGKTTLLRALLQAADARTDDLLYLPQDLARDDEDLVLRSVADDPAALRTRTLDIVAALGVDPSRVLASARPSPGEMRKLVLARGLARQVWGLLLDEPTNHLDLPSIERLQEALDDYPGALLIVSHDEVFAASLTDTAWTISGDRVVVQ